MKESLADKVYVGEENKIIVDTLSVDEGSTYLCWNNSDRRGRLSNKQCVREREREREREMNLPDTLYIREKGRKFVNM